MSIHSKIIGFDGKRAAQNRTGLGNYSRFVISGLARYADASALLVYAPSPKRINCLDGVDKEKGVKMVYPDSLLSRAAKSLWRVMGVTGRLSSDGVSLFHGLSNELPLNIRQARGVRSIVTIHDLIFLRHPECYGRIDRAIYDFKFRRACRNADRVIAVSECTKRDVVNFYGASPDKVDVVYQGCDEQFWHEAAEADKVSARRKYNLPAHYILYVGSIERRKNLMLLAKALLRLPADTQVVALGKRTPYADDVARFCADNGLEGRFRMISGVPFGLFPAIYQMADMMVYPSRFEGFGIPLLEALVSGIPAIGCTGSCLEEAGGPSSLYVSPDDDAALAEAIRRVSSEPGLRSRMIEEGRAYAQNFRQDRLTSELVKVYEDVLSTQLNKESK